MASEITGVQGAEIKLAVVKAPGGHKIELLEYLAPPERKGNVDLRPCDVGFVHVALIVNDLDAILSAINASGWKAAGKPQTFNPVPTPESASFTFAIQMARPSSSCSRRKAGDGRAIKRSEGDVSQINSELSIGRCAFEHWTFLPALCP